MAELIANGEEPRDGFAVAMGLFNCQTPAATVATRDVKSALRGHGRRQEIRLPVLAREQKSCQRSGKTREDRGVPPSSGGYLIRQVHRGRSPIRH